MNAPPPHAPPAAGAQQPPTPDANQPGPGDAPNDKGAEETPDAEAVIMTALVGMDELADKGLPPGVDSITVSGLQGEELTISAVAPGGQPMSVTLAGEEAARRVAAISTPDVPDAAAMPAKAPPMPPKAPAKAPPPGAKQ